MKKRVLIGFVVVAVLLLALPIANLVVGPPGGVSLVPEAAADPALRAAAGVFESKCVGCHAAGAKLPFYAALPVASGVIRQDVERGTRALDLKAEFAGAGAGAVGEVVLAKAERAVMDGSMPPTKYLLLHWDGGLSDADRQAVLGWVAETRKAHYATPGEAPALAANVLQPLPLTVEVDARKAALGEKLFHDPRLSGDGTISCATCHALEKGGTDQAAVSTGIRGQRGPINSPTVYNARYHLAQFWDGRAADLFEQAGGPVENPLEMGAKFPEVLAKLAQDPALVAEITAVYPEGLTDRAVRDAIAEFEKSLVTPNAPFDRFLRGDAAALSADQKAGHALFLETGCATCHVGKALGGQSFERMGQERDYFAQRGGGMTDADQGRFNVTKAETDRRRFKVPSLRNIAKTFPYFHDGSAPDLLTAVKMMAAVQRDRDLTEGEARQVVAFLESLTGEFRGQPLP